VYSAHTESPQPPPLLVRVRLTHSVIDAQMLARWWTPLPLRSFLSRFSQLATVCKGAVHRSTRICELEYTDSCLHNAAKCTAVCMAHRVELRRVERQLLGLDQ
jgi:hypothetical protein